MAVIAGYLKEMSKLKKMIKENLGDHKAEKAE